MNEMEQEKRLSLNADKSLRRALDIQKVRNYVEECIESLEKNNYAHVVSGYSGTSDGGKYDHEVQRHAQKIVAKLSSLGYTYTTRHGHGCYDWRFEKDFKL